jgi:DNA-nicking Smr family endonuclease
MRPLDEQERALWAKVIATVRPLRPQPVREPAPIPQIPPPLVPPRARPTAAAPTPVTKLRSVGETLDGSWDRRLARGLAAPEMTVDLHGHNLARAYDLVDLALSDAITSGVRLLLLITGKPPASPDRPVARGAIRAAVGDWLAASRHADRIAAVRNAHPRHGGSGALYIVLRRPRP